MAPETVEGHEVTPETGPPEFGRGVRNWRQLPRDVRTGREGARLSVGICERFTLAAAVWLGIALAGGGQANKVWSRRLTAWRCYELLSFGRRQGSPKRSRDFSVQLTESAGSRKAIIALENSRNLVRPNNRRPRRWRAVLAGDYQVGDGRQGKGLGVRTGISGLVTVNKQDDVVVRLVEQRRRKGRGWFRSANWRRAIPE